MNYGQEDGVCLRPMSWSQAEVHSTATGVCAMQKYVPTSSWGSTLQVATSQCDGSYADCIKGLGIRCTSDRPIKKRGRKSTKDLLPFLQENISVAHTKDPNQSRLVAKPV